MYNFLKFLKLHQLSVNYEDIRLESSWWKQVEIECLSPVISFCDVFFNKTGHNYVENRGLVL